MNPCGAGAVLSITMFLLALSEPLAIDAGTAVLAVTPLIVTPAGRLKPVTFSL